MVPSDRDSAAPSGSAQGTPAAVPSELMKVFDAGGAAGALMREVDWSATPIGSPHNWPQSLRSAVDICLSSRFPMVVLWGPKLVKIYNDAYTPVLGDKHPDAMGRPLEDVWAEIGDTNEPMFVAVLNGKGAIFHKNKIFQIERHGYLEECYFTSCYSPLHDESGRPGGILVTCTETSAEVVDARRLAALRSLASAVSEARTAREVLERTGGALSGARADVPFSLLYLVEDERDTGRVDARSRRKDDRKGAAVRLVTGFGVNDITAEDAAFTAEALAALDRPEPAVVHRAVAPSAGNGLVTGDLVTRELVVPLRAVGARGVLVAGVSPRRPWDDDYRNFFTLVADQITRSMSSAVAYTAERDRAGALADLIAAKTTFFANISHEFRTPLTLILGPALDALTDTGFPLPQPQRERVELVRRNALRLLRLVNSLLDFARLEAGQLEARYVPVDLAAYTAELASMFQSAIERAGLTLVVECPPLPEPVWIDRDHWDRIVLNLLSNAVKYTLSGSITVQVTTAGAPPERWAELSVIDTGIGIDSDQQDGLFERFRRVPGAGGRSHEGAGIGLALVAELTALHGGNVAVSSTAGTGSTFTVRLPFGYAHLPAEQVDPTGGPAPGGPASATGPPGTNGRPTAAEPAGPSPGLVDEFLVGVPRAAVRSPEDEWGYPQVPRPGEMGFATAGHPDPHPGGADGPSRVLVVEDSADMRDYLVRLLSGEYEVSAAPDGAMALRMIREAPPDLVLTDVMMPNMDGFAMLDAIRRDPLLAHLPVIVLSARAGDEATVAGLDAGADDYLAKPFSCAELLARVRTNLELDRARRAGAHYLHLLDDFPLLIWRSDPDGKFDYVNKTWQAFTGGSLEQELGEAWIRRVHPDDLDDCRTEYQNAFDAGKPFETEFRLRHADGSYRWVLAIGHPIFNLAGRRTGYIGSCLDLTDRIRAEEALRTTAAAEQAAAREHQIAAELQANLLPAATSAPGTLRTAVYYRADGETDVGGDWYDVVELNAGRVALSIGDVMGRGVRAAALMGQLRAAVRAYARLELPPGDVLALLDGVFRDLSEDSIVTCVYAVYDPVDRSLTFASAGHLPPLLVDRQGTVRRLTGGSGPPLGTGLADFAQQQVTLPHGVVLALYTDGLVEQRGRDIDAGIDEFGRYLAALRESPLADLPGLLVDRMLPNTQDDDIALLLVQVPGSEDLPRGGTPAPSAATRPPAARDRHAGAPARAAGGRRRGRLSPPDPRSAQGPL